MTGRTLRKARPDERIALIVIANRNVLGFYEAVGFETVEMVPTPLGPIAARMEKRLEFEPGRVDPAVPRSS